MSDCNELLVQIAAAFPAEPIVADDSLVHDPNDWEGEEINRFFLGKSSRDLGTDELVGKYYSALWFFTPAAFRYYLPAFMLAEIEIPIESPLANKAGASVLAQFKHSPSVAASHALKERVRLLSTAQRSTIASFLSYLQVKYNYSGAEVHEAISVVFQS